MWRRFTNSLSKGEIEHWGWWETAALLGFISVVAKGIRWHEGWADEAQAWLIARDMGWWDMMLHGLHNEGSPGLWHSLLWILARLHFSYLGMHYVAGASAVAGAAVFLRYAPFPRYLKLLLPFTFFIAYQDAVVARSYVLYTLLGFGVAALLRRRVNRPILLAVLLGLIANISSHGLTASAGLGLVVLIGGWRRGQLDRRYAAAVVLLLVFWGISLGTALPHKDTDFPIQKLAQKDRVWAADRHGVKRWLWQRDELPVDPDPNLPHIVTPNEADSSRTMQAGELAPIPFQYPHRRTSLRWALRLSKVMGTITFPFSESRIVALSTVGTLILLAFCYRDKGPGDAMGWLALAPYASIVIPFSILYLAPAMQGCCWSRFSSPRGWHGPGSSRAGLLPGRRLRSRCCSCSLQASS